MNALGYALLFFLIFLLIDKKSATRMTSFLSKMTGSDDKDKDKKHSSYPIKYPKNTLVANYYPLKLRFNDGDDFGYCK